MFPESDNGDNSCHTLMPHIMKGIPYAVAVLDTHMRYVAYSQRWLADYHLPETSLIGRSHYEIFPEISDEWKQMHRECLAGATLSRIDDPFPRQNGRIDYVTWKIEPWRSADDAIGGIIMYTTVSTQKVIAEKKNRRYEQEMLVLLESTKAIPWRIDYVTKQFTYMGSQIEQLLGYPAESLSGIETWASHIHPDDRELALETCRRMTEKGQDHDIEYRVITANGKILWLRDVVSVTKNTQDDVTALTGLFIDISEQKLSEERLRNSKQQYHAVIETSGDGFWLTDSDGFILETNDTYAKLSGYSKEELVGMHISTLEALEDSEQTAQHIETIIKTGSDLFETRHRKKSGAIWDVEISTSYTPSSGGRFSVFARDITERKRTQRELHLIAEVFRNTSEGIVITDPNGVIINVNDAYCKITGYRRDEMIGSTPGKLKSDRHDKSFYQRMWATLIKEGSWVGEIWDRRKNGEIYPKWLNINAIHDENGSLTHYVGTFSDISELKGIEHKLEKMAYFDPLTGLPNRSLFKDRLENEINNCRRFGQRCAVLFLDLDRFKLINDTLGHAIGDELLVEVSRRIETKVRSNDTIARMGGDEFTLLLSRIPNADAAAMVAQNIIHAMLEPICLRSEEIRVGASMGIAIYPEDGLNYETLMRHADTAMYEAKSSGRGQYHFFSDYMDKAAHEHLRLEHDLHRALDEEQFFLEFQPQIDASSGKTVRCEALIRWQHPKRDVMPPDMFIPFAEESGLIIPIGNWVIREVCRQIQLWREYDIAIPPVAINLSARQFRQEDLVKHITTILGSYQVPVELIEFEITETVAMENAESALRRLSALAEHGFSLAIDDFGTGYSSLSYLKTFPVNKLKLDRSFVRDIPTDSNDAAIASAVIQMANSLALEVVAEGVETAEQRDFLLARGCHIMQGYLFHPPLSSSQYLAQLEAGAQAELVT